MCSEFGMRFTPPGDSNHPWNKPGHAVAWGQFADTDCGGFSIVNAAGDGLAPLRFSEPMNPLYVHPDSLHLLEPRADDLVLAAYDPQQADEVVFQEQAPRRVSARTSGI